MPHAKLNISLPEPVVAEIDARGDQRSTIIARLLERYFEAVRRERAALRELFSNQEIALILDACNGTMFADPVAVQLVGAGIEDAMCMDGLAAKWNVDGGELGDKLRGLDYAARMALVDAVQLWWERVGNGEQTKHADALAPAASADAEVASHG